MKAFTLSPKGHVLDICQWFTSEVVISISEPSVHYLVSAPIFHSSLHVSTAAVPDRLPQHLPALHHGEHAADHPQRLHHLPADASHPSARHGSRHVAPGTARRYPLPCRSSRYGPPSADPPPPASPGGGRSWSMLSVCLWSSGYLFQTPRSKWPSPTFCDLLFIPGLQKIWLLLDSSIGNSRLNFHLLSGRLQQADLYSSLPFAALLLSDQSVFGSTNRWRWWVTAKCIRCSYIQKLMDQFLLFTVGPLLLSVKGIIDLAQMPPTILLPHPGGTGTPTLERIAFLPGAQPPFPPRAFNPTSISPGEDPPLPPSPHLVFPYLPSTISVSPLTSVRAQPCSVRVRGGKVSSSWVFLQSCWEGSQNLCDSLRNNWVVFCFLWKVRFEMENYVSVCSQWNASDCG